MTPEQRKAVERLTAIVDTSRSMAERVPVQARDLRTLLALVREPVASVEGRVARVGYSYVDVVVDHAFGGLMTLPYEGATVGQRLRIDVHAVDAGEEK